MRAREVQRRFAKSAPLGRLALEEAVERPDFACAQTLETNPHAGRLLGTAGLNPTNFARHLNRFGLGRDLEADLQPSLQGKSLLGFHEETTQRNIPRGGGDFLIAYDDLDVQPACVAGICATKMI